MLRIAAVLLLAANAHAWDHVYTAFDALLHAHVRDGLVDYAALQDRPDELLAVQNDFELLTREEFDTFTEPEQLAFWINAYNLYTLRLIVDNYPLASIRDLTRPWKREFFALLGERMSLDDIEHGIIRKEFNEPRIHYALVCAAVSCPVLQDWAYTADNLDSQLDQAGKMFLQDTARNRIAPDDGVIRVSSIFKWYGDDFDKDGKTFVDDIMRLTGISYPEPPKVTFLKYDWSLNDVKGGQ